jgi:hypothetical protein
MDRVVTNYNINITLLCRKFIISYKIIKLVSETMCGSLLQIPVTPAIRVHKNCFPNIMCWTLMYHRHELLDPINFEN